MKIRLIWPQSVEVPTGNRCTAEQYAEIFSSLGHEVSLGKGGHEETTPFDGDVLVALHGIKSRPGVLSFRALNPNKKIVLVLTGTDIYGAQGGSPALMETMAAADQLVVLQAQAADRVPSMFRNKVVVMVQSVKQMPAGHDDEQGRFAICVVGHLRDEKDPMRAAEASRMLPAASTLVIHHAGAILDPAYESLVEQEVAANPRYTWMGSLAPEATRQLIADSRLLVHPSKMEGGSRVVGEAVVAGTPVLASRIDAHLSLLGADYPGLFDVGDTPALSDLMWRAERDPAFYAAMVSATQTAAAQFDPGLEMAAWAKLLECTLPPSRFAPTADRKA